MYRDDREAVTGRKPRKGRSSQPVETWDVVPAEPRKQRQRLRGESKKKDSRLRMNR